MGPGFRRDDYSMLRPGQRYRDRRAHAERRLDVEPAAVAEHDMLDDGEAEAGAADRAAAPRIDPVEALGQAGDMGGGNAFALVDHADPEQIGRPVLKPNADRRPGSAVSERVDHEVVQHLAELDLVA